MMVEGFRRLNVGNEAINGTRLSAHSSVLQTSTGIQSLDLILGNGVNLSSSILLQEQDRGEYTPLFAKHFISEGLTHGHIIVCVGERVENWVKVLPKPIQQQDRDLDPDIDLKIAWRYKRKIQNRYSHSYDLSQHRPIEEVMEYAHVLTDYNTYEDILAYITNIVEEHSERNVVRIILDRPIFPISDESALNRFIYIVHRTILAKRNVVMMCVYPSLTLSDSLSFHLAQHFNYVLSVKSLPKEENSVYKEYHGILNLDKIGNFKTFTIPLYDLTDRFFKIKRKKFIIEKMYLPPDLSETVSRSSHSGSAGCNTASGLDF